MVVGCVPAWVDVSAEPFHHCCRMCSRMGGCKCRSLPQMIVDVSYHVGGCECCAFSQMVVGVSYHADGCKYKSFP